MFILDCRPMKNAMANRFNGGGVESAVSYPNCVIDYLNIPNIHAVSAAFARMQQAIASRARRSVSEFYAGIGDWLDCLQSARAS